MRRSCCATAGNDDGEAPENENGPIMESAVEVERQTMVRGEWLLPSTQVTFGVTRLCSAYDKAT
jgi:hypothetical protein